MRKLYKIPPINPLLFNSVKVRLTSRITCLIIVLIVASSCSLTKRVHNPGWHISFLNRSDSNNDSIRKTQKPKANQNDLNSPSKEQEIRKDTISIITSGNKKVKAELLSKDFYQEEIPEKNFNSINYGRRKLKSQNSPISYTATDSIDVDEPEEEKQKRSTFKTILLILLFLLIFAAGINISAGIVAIVYYIFQNAFLSAIPGVFIGAIPVFFFIWGYFFFLLKAFFLKNENMDPEVRKTKINRIALIIAAAVCVIFITTLLVIILAV